MIALADLTNYNQDEIIEHLMNKYCETPQEIENAKNALDNMDVLVAYESVGDYGCDSSSFFLLRSRNDGKLYEIHGSHCSCYGFEGQFHLDETTIEALRYRVENGGRVFYTGGYDDEESANEKAVFDFIMNINQ